MAPVIDEATRSSRAPMRASALAHALVRPGTLWSQVQVVAETGSTNADVAQAARAGGPEGLVLVAESQIAGRGRLGRSWQAPAGAGLTMSVLLRPTSVAAARHGWLPLLTGVAVMQVCAAEVGGVDAALKWPNDLLVRPIAGGRWGKCGGILAEVADDAIVIGIGINVSQDRAELPEPMDPLAYPPTSLAIAGGRGDRERLAVAVLERLSHWYARWSAVAGDPDRSGLAAAYRSLCRTLGRRVTVTLPGGDALRGTATDIDRDGRLLVRAPDGEHRLAAGDVHHLRDTP
jgi:BirA family biotin operon repressor/biotin-[acetyl-CoA-carboxylase] ligase